MTLSVLLAAMATAVVMALAAPPAAGARRTADQQPVERRAAMVGAGGRRGQRLLDDAYPDMLDLFVVSVQAGRLPFEALVSIAQHVHPAIERAIGDVQRRVERGQRLNDALDALVDELGSRALSFVGTLRMAERTGLAVVPMIDRIADDARLHRRRRAEASARELPVRLSVPLVLCTLPSFVLVAIAPLLIGALSSLHGT